MAKLFLIRRNLETFTGPMTLGELKEAYKRMDFGLQDEVSGHCGPWVQLDQSEQIRRQYPDVARIVIEGLNGWGVSNEPQKIVNDAEPTRRVWKPARRSGALAFTFLFIATLAFAAALYMASGSRLAGKAKSPESNPLPEEAQGFLDRQEHELFDSYVEANLPEITTRIGKQKKLEQTWLPYLRHYAFAHDGVVPGLSPKALRGAGAASAPIDCSYRAWRQRWRSSLRSWNGYVTERKLARAHWARLLAWDPHWINRREHKGWLPGENYYLGCLMMADKALAEMYTDTSLVQVASDWDKLGINKIKQRLQWLLEVTRTGTSNLSLQPGPEQPLAVWSCLEGARELKDLPKCRAGINADAQPDPWLAYTDERLGWNLLRIGASQKGNLPADVAGALATYATKAGRADFFTRFDYRAEQRLLRVLVKDQKPGEKPSDKAAERPADKSVEKTVQRVYSDFPEMGTSP